MADRPTDVQHAVSEFLSRLEAREARLLSWGLVDGSFSQTEIFSAAEAYLTDAEAWGVVEDSADLVRELLDRRALFDFDVKGERRYRTRMAEGVRLMSRLRQLFPRDMHDRRWQSAPTLVADFRFLHRRRLFPVPRVEPTVALAALEQVCSLDPTQREVLSGMLGDMKLRDFQLRAARRILGDDRGDTLRASPRATIVTAGTGSGKTLAFYLPAYLDIAATLSAGYWVRCLAIYPRNELLKDQLSEAYARARRIDAPLARAGRRKLLIGTLFGMTPNTATAFDYTPLPTGWTSASDGHICPFIRCPRCQGDMVWPTADRRAARERLRCTTPRCPQTVEADELVLTRRRMLDQPPDVLFTTTEMLNQRLSDSQYGALFGVGVAADRKPRMVLLDEVHTYGGISGAQVALLLRRWQHAARCRPHFVALSATLRDSARFMATLVGVDATDVEEVTPRSDELRPAGMEYLVALRGDPVAQTSLLSTTIQTSMLLHRLLDPLDDAQAPSGALFGRRGFVFTDDLDVTNRLFFKLRDAEGLDSWGQPLLTRPEGSLANLRHDGPPDEEPRFRLGQSWSLCQRIGHNLTAGTYAHISRTDSQDPGVDRDADLIVATAALEVGFNDPRVGAVVQHKAPRDAAQFLQRKGRAGRDPAMRPWTVVVLSDYGKDRVAYQGYDLLFEPELRSRELPVANHYVLRMQAVYAFMDWLGEKVRELRPGSVWRDLSAPWTTARTNAETARARQRREAEVVREVLEQPDRREELLKYVAAALRVSEETAEGLMWEPPRSLLTGALPTALRRLQSEWRCPRADGTFVADYHLFNSPLPEFVPRALFEDLNLPEVSIVVPAQQRGGEASTTAMPILQAMSEFCPGRVSWRFNIENQFARLWVEPPFLQVRPTNSLLTGDQLEIDRFVSVSEELGTFQYVEDGQVADVACVRPRELRPTRPPRKIADSSTSFLRWDTQIIPSGDGIVLDLPRPCRWSDLIVELRVFTHNQQSPVEVRRFSRGADATVVFEDHSQVEGAIHFVRQDAPDAPPTPVACGFVLDVDGLRITFRPPTDFRLEADPDKLAALRTSRFIDLVRHHATLDELANVFVRQWLGQIYLSAVTAAAVATGATLQEACARLHSGDAGAQLVRVLEAIFQTLPVPEDDDAGASVSDAADSGDNSGAPAHAQAAHPAAGGGHQRLHGTLQSLLCEPVVLRALRESAESLWAAPDGAWHAWLAEKFKTTLGAATLAAISQLCPDLDAGDLVLDIDPGPTARGTGADRAAAGGGVEAIWITETTVGGGGIIEKVHQRYAEDPRGFFSLLEEALEPSDFEVVDRQLTSLLEWAHEPSESSVRDAIRDVRAAREDSHARLESAFNRLLTVLATRGMVRSHPVVAAINARILRPGSSTETDRLLRQLVRGWRDEERRLGIEIDARVFAYVCSESDDLDAALGGVMPPSGQPTRQWRFGTVYSMLWPRGVAIRARKLGVYSRYRELPPAEASLLEDCLRPAKQVVPLTDPRWRDLATGYLATDGVCALQAPAAASARLGDALPWLLAQPIDTGLMILHPCVAGVRPADGNIELKVQLRESL